VLPATDRKVQKSAGSNASRRVVGHAMADQLRTELVAGALANAVAGRSRAPGVIRPPAQQPEIPQPSPAELEGSHRNEIKNVA
jgi:hypothetical protein